MDTGLEDNVADPDGNRAEIFQEVANAFVT
jgi:hypothetical protein